LGFGSAQPAGKWLLPELGFDFAQPAGRLLVPEQIWNYCWCLSGVEGRKMIAR